MTQNVMQVSWELIYMFGGAAILLVSAVLVAIRHRPKVLPGSKGHRDSEDQAEIEEIRPDGYIDSFAKVIEEAGGSMPLIVKVALPGVLVWWLLYLILFWRG
jgi:hypothetical protein